MLNHIGERAAAGRVDLAVKRVLAKGEILTPDLGGSASTGDVTDAIIAEL